MEDSRVVAAIIAGVVSILGIIVNYLVSNTQIKNNVKELEIKEKELESNQRNFKVEMEFRRKEIRNIEESLESQREELMQNQMQSIMEKRLEAYPILWSIHIRYETNWAYEKRKKNRKWAQKYVDELNEFNINHGLFFSQDLYSKFFQLRRELYSAIESVEDDDSKIPENICQNIRKIVYGGDGKPGLSTIEKDDLGSYINVVIAKRKK